MARRKSVVSVGQFSFMFVIHFTSHKKTQHPNKPEKKPHKNPKTINQTNPSPSQNPRKPPRYYSLPWKVSLKANNAANKIHLFQVHRWEECFTEFQAWNLITPWTSATFNFHLFHMFCKFPVHIFFRKQFRLVPTFSTDHQLRGLKSTYSFSWQKPSSNWLDWSWGTSPLI